MGRLSYSLLLVVVATCILLGWALDQWYEAQVKESNDPVLEAYTSLGQELALWLDTQTMTTDSADWPAQSLLQPQLLAYGDFPLPQNVRNNFERGEPLVLDTGAQLSLHYYLPARQQVLSLTLPETLHLEHNTSLRWLLTLLFYTGVVLVVLIWLYPLLRRLALLRKHAQDFGAGQLHSRIPQAPHSYIHLIEVEFNRMAQRIEQLIADNKLLARGLSHDLRTPLARLRFGIDVLEDSGLNREQMQHLTHLNRDLIAMEKLVEALLEYARLEQAQIAFHPTPLCLAEFIEHLCQDFYADQVTWHCAPDALTRQINADPEYLSMLLHNLVQNALSYGRQQVLIALGLKAEGLYLSVEDDGPGIAREERDNVLKPFYRVSRDSNASHGHGLGLAIVERIAHWHKAELTLARSSQLGGLQATIFFNTKQ